MSETLAESGVGVSMPWSAWREDCTKIFAIPPGWQCSELRMTDARTLSSDDIVRALDAPIGAPSLQTLAKHATSASIAIDDLTRPMKAAPLLSPVLDRLIQGGIPSEKITVVVATGAHRPAEERDVVLKIG